MSRRLTTVPPLRGKRKHRVSLMRILQIVKTSDGARWAALQAGELVRLGADVHVALPCASGSHVKEWEDAKVTIHVAPLDYPARTPWHLPSVCSRARALVASLKPDIIHAHHVGPALVMRQALGQKHPIPRVFQVPGPLHLEHWPFRAWELSLAGANDFWIASSRCIKDRYVRAGVHGSKLFLSYYGFRSGAFSTVRSNLLRRRLNIPADALVVGNISYIYAPKYYLGQRVGLKCHEDLIAALAVVLRRRSNVFGVLAGGPWARASRYAQELRQRAEAIGGGRILMPGQLALSEVLESWPDFDCAIHVPLSENCGGVVEPLLAAVPTIAGNVGGLPEVVIDGLTGRLVPIRNPGALAESIFESLTNPEEHRGMARLGRELVATMFDVRRTAREVYQVYCHILDRAQDAPPEFDARLFLADRVLNPSDACEVQSPCRTTRDTFDEQMHQTA
jgi:glycosyltransferase involved in cell wall biosynthesis